MNYSADSNAIRRIFVRRRSIILGILLLVVLLIAGMLTVDGFISTDNLRSMLLLAAFLGLASLGQTLCALVGAIDMSIPFVIGAANIALAYLLTLDVPPPIAALIVVACGGAIGIANGLLTHRLKGQALIMTLAVGFTVVGGTQIITSIGSEYGGNVVVKLPVWLTSLATITGTTFGLRIPPVIVFWILTSVVLLFVMQNTWFGRSLYALGGNRTAAQRLSISDFRAWLSVYAISGGMAAVTGCLLLGFSGGGFVGVGDPYLFTTVAAVVIGGTSLLGGWGGYGASIIGVLVLTVLTSLLVGLGFSYASQQAVIGLLIVPMVALYARSPHIRMQV
jgi:ribose transport system permease protein